MGGYIGANGTARRIKGGYIGINGIARKIKAGYIGVNGVARKWLSGGKDIAGMTIGYSSSNWSDKGVVTMGDGNDYRLLEIRGSGTLTLEYPVLADVWCCGGGGGGGRGQTHDSTSHPRGGGGGGGGGYVAEKDNASLPSSVAIVIGGEYGDSSIGALVYAAHGEFGYNGRKTSLPIGGEGGWGGSGGGGGDAYPNTRPEPGSGGLGAGVTTRPFGDTYYGTDFCVGGMGGTHASGGVNGGSGEAGTTMQPAEMQGANGTYYGCGGGGGGCPSKEGECDGGSGYQGLAIIRIPVNQ